MSSIRQSNRTCQSRDYWDLTNSFSHWRQSSAFIIYTEPPEDLGSELSHEDLDSELSHEDLGLELSDKDLSPELSDKDLGSELSHEDLGSELSDKDLGSELSDEDLSLELDKDLSELLSRQLHEDLDVNSLYQF